MRFCVIGTGRAGQVHARNLKSRVRGAALAAICDSDPRTLEEVGRQFEVPTLHADYCDAVRQADVDAVVLATPTIRHREIACAAASAGKHVFLEKPMAATVGECREIIAAAQKAGVKLQIGFMRRFDARFLDAKKTLVSGELGRVMLIKSTGRGPGLPPPWVYDVDASNGILAEVNSHDFDSIRWLSGSEITRVYAEANNFRCLHVQDEYPRFYDNVIVNLRLANDVLGMVDGTCPCHYGYDARVEIVCGNGVFHIGGTQEPSVARLQRDGRLQGKTVKSWFQLFKDAYVAELEHFVHCVVEDAEPRVTGLDGLKAVEAAAAANESILQGRPVEILRESEILRE